MRDWMLVASDEATSGSVIAKHERISPASSGSSHRRLLLGRAVAGEHFHVAGVGRRAVEHLRRDIGDAAHDLAERRVFEVGQAGAVLALRQEQVPQPRGARLRLSAPRRSRVGCQRSPSAICRWKVGFVRIDVLVHERGEPALEIAAPSDSLEHHGAHDSLTAAVEDTRAPVRSDEQLDWPRLATYLRQRLPTAMINGLDLAATMEVSQFPGGHSNLTYLVRFGGTELVLRRPPLGPVPPKAHDMAREYRWLAAHQPGVPAGATAVPALRRPDVIGSVFYAMERRRGIVIRHDEPPAIATSERRGAG